jgi:glutathione S-transferase
MSRFQLISFKACPWVQRAAIVLREKNIEFEFIHIEADKRPDWFKAVSPHGKVPVLRIDEDIALFESNAIAEFLDETIGPRLHPADPVKRAVNRAWTDFLPSFAAALGPVHAAEDEPALAAALEKLAAVFGPLEAALAARSSAGPWFNGAAYSLVDASYAPFLQRWLIIQELIETAPLDAFPLLAGWARALVERSSTHSFPPQEFRALFLAVLARRGGWFARRADNLVHAEV